MKRSIDSDEYKLGNVNEVLTGESVVTVARKSLISQVLLYRWINKYKTTGKFEIKQRMSIN